MDRKAYIVLLASFLMLMLWYPLVNKFFPPTPLARGTNLVTNALNNDPRDSSNRVSPRFDSIENAPESVVPAPPPFRSSSPEKTVTIENENAVYTFSSHGGGLKSIELKHHPAHVMCDEDQQTSELAKLNAPARVPALTILGGERIEGDGIFDLTPFQGGVRAEKLLASGLRVVKEVRLSTNYLLKASVRFENSSTQPLAVDFQEWVVGSATPMTKNDQAMYMGLQWYNGTKAETVNESWFANKTLGCFPGNPRTQYAAGASNVVWTSVQNQFFTMIVIPDLPAPRVVGRKINLPPPTQDQLAADTELSPEPFGIQASFIYPGMTLDPSQSVERTFDIYAGPKEYRTLANTLSQIGDRTDLRLDLVMQFGFFGWFAKGLLLSMNGLYSWGLSYGLAIVVITIIIKLLFWPLTKASMKSMKRMSALQPQMKALQEKYKDDPKKMNMKLMEFMKENRVSPLGGCLPMLFQIPVFIGFYTMLGSAIELRGAEFLWACDLSRGDTIATIPGINFPINPMPLLMGATMLWQARMTPVSPGMDPMQQKIMKYMPLMFMVFLYNFSAGLTLYWTVQNLLTIAQMKLTKANEPAAQPGAVPALPPSKALPAKKKKRS
ncbi:MAG: membrane protein insertase YidC [Verrucomicrobia bacterium]|nr:membrane protein insertase YidC [Verrucomicrobiota bacterium]